MTGITWRQIEKALQDYFGGVSNSGTGDFIAEIEAAISLMISATTARQPASTSTSLTWRSISPITSNRCGDESLRADAAAAAGSRRKSGRCASH